MIVKFTLTFCGFFGGDSINSPSCPIDASYEAYIISINLKVNCKDTRQLIVKRFLRTKKDVQAKAEGNNHKNIAIFKDYGRG